MPLVLMLTLAVAAAASALALQTSMERPIAAVQARTAALRVRADDGVAEIVAALSQVPTWASVPASGVNAPSLVPTTQVVVGGRTVLVAPITSRLDARLGAQWPRAAATPRWLPIGGHADGLTGVCAWVADDPADPDSSALVDTNERVLVRVHAFGAGGGELAVQVLVARVSGVTRVLTWREDG
jgi:hypothetical protein